MPVRSPWGQVCGSYHAAHQGEFTWAADQPGVKTSVLEQDSWRNAVEKLE